MRATATTYVKLSVAVAGLGLLVLVSCTEEAPIIAQTDDVDAFALSVLDGIQPVSIAESREYCGYIYETDAGTLAATAPRRGGEDFCDLPAPDNDVLASYHTHGGYSELYDNEVPSVDDMQGDLEAGIDGYIATPAGRIWLVDHEAQLARQLCNVMCITSDPNDDPQDAGFIPQTFTLDELQARFN